MGEGVPPPTGGGENNQPLTNTPQEAQTTPPPSDNNQQVLEKWNTAESSGMQFKDEHAGQETFIPQLQRQWLTFITSDTARANVLKQRLSSIFKMPTSMEQLAAQEQNEQTLEERASSVAALFSQELSLSPEDLDARLRDKIQFRPVSSTGDETPQQPTPSDKIQFRPVPPTDAEK